MDASFRERLRVVVGVTLSDSVNCGEVVQEFASGQVEAALQYARTLANEMRGEFVAVDLWSHKLIWERFACVSYEPWMEVDMPAGIITNRHERSRGPSVDEVMEREKQLFEQESKRREAEARRAANRAKPKERPKDATSH